MTTTRTVTVHDHEVSVRTVSEPDAAPNKPFTGITGGRRTAAFTAGVGILVFAIALMPAIVHFFH